MVSYSFSALKFMLFSVGSGIKLFSNFGFLIEGSGLGVLKKEFINRSWFPS